MNKIEFDGEVIQRGLGRGDTQHSITPAAVKSSTLQLTLSSTVLTLSLSLFLSLSIYICQSLQHTVSFFLTPHSLSHTVVFVG